MNFLKNVAISGAKVLNHINKSKIEQYLMNFIV